MKRRWLPRFCFGVVPIRSQAAEAPPPPPTSAQQTGQAATGKAARADRPDGVGRNPGGAPATFQVRTFKAEDAVKTPADEFHAT